MSFNWPADHADEVEQHRRERADNGFSEFDWWNFDTYIAHVIAEGVKKFRDEGHGHPADMTHEEFKALCTEIHDSLKVYADDAFLGTYKEEVARHDAAKAAMHLFADRFSSFWD